MPLALVSIVVIIANITGLSEPNYCNSNNTLGLDVGSYSFIYGIGETILSMFGIMICLLKMYKKISRGFETLCYSLFFLSIFMNSLLMNNWVCVRMLISHVAYAVIFWFITLIYMMERLNGEHMDQQYIPLVQN
jgi:hypothetical protein